MSTDRTIRNVIFAAAVGVVFVLAVLTASNLLYVIKHWARI